jgi:EAL domain-containing protein (putative c-di-GMP-specific phosphodiesterase class I)
MTQGRLRVAIVDDEQEIREALSALISTDPNLDMVGSAGDALEAESLVREARPDVVLMDVRMPNGGGPLATKRIRRAWPSTRVIAVSAYDDRTTVFDMLRAGAAGYVVKGSPGDDILEAIRRAGAGQGLLSPEVSAEVVSELATRLDAQASRERADQARADEVRTILREPGRLGVAFQPVVSLSSGRPVAVEALARFPQTPKVKPTMWFARAEAVGLRVELEKAALELALETASARPPEIELAVNLSPAMLERADVADMLADPRSGRVIVEITENAQVEDYRALQQALDPIRKRGVRLAVDDAGAGFSSFRHILQLSPDIIKVDITLTRGIDADRAKRALAAALITFTTEIGADIIAEGIETAAELEALRSLGVGFGQGFFLGRPGRLEALAPVG